MLARIHSTALAWIEALGCEVEVDVTGRGFGVPTLVGLPDSAVKESIDRIRSALTNSGFAPPRTRTTINLAPADVRKEGPAFDLPIAVGLLLADDQFRSESMDEYLMAGELALDGRVRPIKGALSMAIHARENGFDKVILPRENAQEAAVVHDIEVYGISMLAEAVGVLSGELPLEPAVVDLESLFEAASHYEIDFGDVRGQEHVKRALLVAAAGRHNALMIGASTRGIKLLLSEELRSHVPTQLVLKPLVRTDFPASSCRCRGCSRDWGPPAAVLPLGA